MANCLTSTDDSLTRLVAPNVELSKDDEAHGTLLTSTTPISRLHQEILGEIFALVIPPLQRNAPNLIQVPITYEESHPHDARLRLCRVCRAWTRIMYDTPRAWTTVALDRSLPSNIRIVQRYLKQSKSCPLDLYIQDLQIQYPESLLRCFYHMVKEEAHRLRWFCAVESRLDLIARILFSVETPRLGMLMLQARDPIWCPKAYRPASGLVQASNMQQLHVSTARMMDVFSGTFQHLRKLHLMSTSQTPLHKFLQFLSKCPLIEVLHLPLSEEWSGGGEHDETWPRERVSLPSLKELHMPIHDSLSSRRLCESVHIPSLHILNVVSKFGGSPVNRLEALLSDCATSLRHLTVRGPPYDDLKVSLAGLDVLPFFHRLENLERLTISHIILDKSFFMALTPDTAVYPGRGQWPKLHLELISSVFDGDDLLRLLQARLADVGNDGPQYMISIDEKSLPNWKPQHRSVLDQIQEKNTLKIVS